MKIDKINTVLLWIVSVLVLSFIVMVECYNDLSLDDIGFALQLKEKSVFGFIGDMYMTWQGRYTSFFLTGCAIKSYFVFDTTLVYALVMLLINIALLTSAMKMLFGLFLKDALPYAIIIHGLYILSMFDISSYFWICTKSYTLFISITIYVIAKLYRQKNGNFFDYCLIVVMSVFIGASWETYAPIILLFVGCLLLYYWKQCHFSILSLVKTYPLLFMVFIVATIAFMIMVAAPGNWVRMSVHESDAIAAKSNYVGVLVANLIQLTKLLFFRLPYIVLYIFLIGVLEYKYLSTKEKTVKTKQLLKRWCCYIGITLFFLVVSLALNAYAVGARMEMRSFNHVLLLLALCLGLMTRDFVLWEKFQKFSVFNGMCTFFLVLFVVDMIYMLPANYMELEAYYDSRQKREEFIELRIRENTTGVVRLEELDTPIFHSIVEDCSSAVMPSYTRHVLLKPNEVSYRIDNFYNVTYREYYELPFDVITTLSYDL